MSGIGLSATMNYCSAAPGLTCGLPRIPSSMVGSASHTAVWGLTCRLLEGTGCHPSLFPVPGLIVPVQKIFGKAVSGAHTLMVFRIKITSEKNTFS